MSRAHLFRPLTDANGTLLEGASVTLIDPITNNAIAQPIYADDTSSITLPNPFIADTGYVDFYLATPQRVQILATQDQTTVGVYLDIYPPADQLVLADTQFKVINTAQPGFVLVGTDTEGELMWVDPVTGLQPTIPVANPRFYVQVDSQWAVSYTDSVSGGGSETATITITISTNPPWDGSVPGMSAFTLATFTAADLSGKQPQCVDLRQLDAVGLSGSYQYTVTIPPSQTIYWIECVDPTGAVIFDWRRA